MKPKQTDSKTDTDDLILKKYSIAWRLLRTNFVGPQFIIPLFDEFKESRPFILNPKYSTPTSLPLYFFFGYQLLQESNLLKRCGPVSEYIFYLIFEWVFIHFSIFITVNISFCFFRYDTLFPNEFEILYTYKHKELKINKLTLKFLWVCWL